MTKQEIREVIAACGDRLKHVPTLAELVQMTQISHYQIKRQFGGYAQALRECNLEGKEIGRAAQKLPLEKLFADWAGVVRTLKKLPSMSEYEMLSPYTTTPLLRRFGSWRQVPQGLKRFAQSNALAEEWKSELKLVDREDAPTEETTGTVMATVPVQAIWPPGPSKRPLYGPPIWPGPLAYGPVNETGVVFLFGALAMPLGFVVHRLQTEFPDCEALRRVGEERWQRVRIEIEYESRNFLKHMHKASECDLIVCWRHNWPECPVEVVELKKEIAKIAEKCQRMKI